MAVVPPAVEFKANRTPSESSEIVLVVLGWATLLSGRSVCSPVTGQGKPRSSSLRQTAPAVELGVHAARFLFERLVEQWR